MYLFCIGGGGGGGGDRLHDYGVGKKGVHITGQSQQEETPLLLKEEPYQFYSIAIYIVT